MKPEKIIDLVATLVGLGILAFTQNPDPFIRVGERVRAWGFAWNHRISVWEALNAIRSLPETDEES